jgi:carboxymethylenebutenolidase
MTTTTFQLKTPDGPCTTELAAHEGTGPRPAVVLFFDAGGLRPAQQSPSSRAAERSSR